MPGYDDHAFSQQFLTLVDSWLEAYPVTTSALRPPSVRFAAAKVLLYKSGHATKLGWPGEEAARLADDGRKFCHK